MWLWVSVGKLPLFRLEKWKACSTAARWPPQHDLMSDITLTESQRKKKKNRHFRGQLLSFYACFCSHKRSLVCRKQPMPEQTIHKEDHREQRVGRMRQLRRGHGTTVMETKDQEKPGPSKVTRAQTVNQSNCERATVS